MENISVNLYENAYEDVTYFYNNFDYYLYNYTSPLFADNSCSLNWEHLMRSIPGYQLCFHVLLPIICAVGIVGIILTVIILSQKTMSTSTNCYLISLATADLGFLVIMALKSFETKLSREGHYTYMVVMTYIQVFLLVFLLASVWLTVMLAIERYIAICRPLRAMAICTVARARIIIVMIFALSLLFRIPEMFKYKMLPFYDQCLQKEVPSHVVTTLATNEAFRHIYSWTDCVLLAILPFSLLLCLNVCLIREIHRSTNYLRYHLASDSSVQTIITAEEMKITMMLISVVVVFFLCEAPFVIMVILKRLYPDELFPHYHLLWYITVLLLVLRSSFNFILYCWFSEKFWNTCKRTFCERRCELVSASKWLRFRPSNHSDRSGNTSSKYGINYFFNILCLCCLFRL